jgi:MBG domain (YGX type)
MLSAGLPPYSRHIYFSTDTYMNCSATSRWSLLYSPCHRLMRFLCLLLAVVAFAPNGSGQARHTVRRQVDTPSGFEPGQINLFAGNGTNMGTFSNGSVPTQVLLTPFFSVTDSYGNVYIAAASSPTGGIFMVYGGVQVPAALANVTTNASPSVTPQAGLIYQIAGMLNSSCECEGMPLNQVGFSAISGLAIDTQNNLYYSDGETGSGPVPIASVVRKVDFATSNVKTVAGQWGVDNPNFDPTILGDGGPATSAVLYRPEDIKLDKWGNLYIDDNFNDEVRVVYLGSQPPPLLAAEGNSYGTPQMGYIYNVAGYAENYCSSGSSCAGDGGPATSSSAGLGSEFSIALDESGNLYIADSTTTGPPPNGYIRLVYAGGDVPTVLNLYLNPNGGSGTSPSSGYIYPVTGYDTNPQFEVCTAAPCGDGGPAENVTFGYTSIGGPQLYLVTDSAGNLYIADTYGNAVRKIDTSGYASTIAGVDDPAQTLPCSTTVPGPATSTCVYSPESIWFDTQDDLYISAGDELWKVAPVGAQTIDFPAFNPSTVTYGVAPISLTATASSGLPVQYSVTSTPAGIAAINGTALLISGAGSITVTASQPGNSSIGPAAPVSQTLTVNPAPLTVTANSASKVVGSPNPAFTATITGFVNGDTAATLGVYSGAPAFSTTATVNSPAGTYPIVPSIGTLHSVNYTFPPANFIDGVLTVSGNTPQTINFPAFNPSTVNYGHASIVLSASASSGLPVTFLILSGPGTLSGANGSLLTITGAGKIVVEATQPGNLNYLAAPPVSQTLTVAPALLTITGPTVTMSYGVTVNPSAFPPPSITGFVSTDTESTVLTGSVQYATATGTPNAGSYPITVSLGTLALLPAAATNYTFAPTVNGTLIVKAASQAILFNPIPPNQTYGANLILTASASSTLPVTFTLTGPAVFYNGVNNEVVLNGIGTVTVTATQSGNGNYLAAPPVTQTVPVGRAPLNIQAFSTSREQGAQNPVFGYFVGCPAGTGPSPGCFVNGDTDIPSVITGIPLITTPATPSSPPGTYPIVASLGTLAAPNYYFVFLNGTLTVTPPGSYSISASPTSLNFPSGLSAQTTITLTPSNFYQGTITLTCGQVPANMTCTISPSTYNFPGNQASSGFPPVEYNAQGTVTVTGSSAPVVGALASRGSIRSAAIWFIPGALAGLFLTFTRRRAAHFSRIFGLLTILVLATVMLAVNSCGGSSKSLNATPGTSQLMITGSGTSVSGSPVTASLELTVTVQ